MVTDPYYANSTTADCIASDMHNVMSMPSAARVNLQAFPIFLCQFIGPVELQEVLKLQDKLHPVQARALCEEENNLGK